MQYKTITLELLESHPGLAGRLKSAGQLLAALEACSTDLRTRHLILTDQLSQSNPQAEEEELIRQAFEIALRELEARIQFASHQSSPVNPEFLIEHFRLHTPAE